MKAGDDFDHADRVGVEVAGRKWEVEEDWSPVPEWREACGSRGGRV